MLETTEAGAVPVLLYHHINPHRGDTVTVTPGAFAEQMRYLAEAGYRTLTLDALFSHVTGKSPIDGKAVAITFDDGWLDNYIWAYPVLREYRMNAAVFLIAGRTEAASVGPAGILPSIPTHEESKSLIAKGEAGRVVIGWELVKEMQESGLIEFHSHTVSHRKCTGLSVVELASELAESRRIIEKNTGRPCRYLCWPYGAYDDAAVRAAVSAGYEGLFTTNSGAVRSGSDPLAISRIFVTTDDIDHFKQGLTDAIS